MTNRHDTMPMFQFEYFSANYHRFEEDFYTYSALGIPLTFISEDILNMMGHSRQTYFKLNRQNAKDFKTHYFLFRVKRLPETPYVLLYEYIGHTNQLTSAYQQQTPTVDASTTPPPDER